tara:strand:+ start:306 stop:536 length:231 start_codon:yes stop_codon:yes gene_type:complete
VVAVVVLVVEVTQELQEMVDQVVVVGVLDQDNLLQQLDVETHHQQVLLKEIMVVMVMVLNQHLLIEPVVVEEVRVP